jgi:hypothetical protein
MVCDFVQQAPLAASLPCQVKRHKACMGTITMQACRQAPAPCLTLLSARLQGASLHSSFTCPSQAVRSRELSL